MAIKHVFLLRLHVTVNKIIDSVIREKVLDCSITNKYIKFYLVRNTRIICQSP